ncbi:Rha family transcriptional regulator [Faecalimicrobium sp. JNUCC 81]
MNNINKISSENVEILRVDSREVADMVEMRHDRLLRKIDKITKDFNQTKIGVVNYWIESTYKDGKGEERKCYLVTKQGCEFIAHKTTGTKGNIFTHKYMQRFKELESIVHGTKSINPEDIISVVSSKVDNEIDRISNQYSNYIRPLAIDKARIGKYIKQRLGIKKANEDFYLVKERVLILLDADKWEDVPVNKLKNAFNLVDESIDALVRTREIKQTRWF